MQEYCRPARDAADDSERAGDHVGAAAFLGTRLEICAQIGTERTALTDTVGFVADRVDDAAHRANDAELLEHFVAFARSAHPRAPLYSALSAIAARDPQVAVILRRAPAPERVPVLFFAAVHALLLGEPEAELAQWYRNLTAEPRTPSERSLGPVFRRFVTERHGDLEHLVATRTTQTNEVGRCSFLLPVLGLIASEVGPVGHLDVGASGGLNLLLDRYEYHYRFDGSEQTVGGPSTVALASEVRGDMPVPNDLPEVTSRCGVDRRPIDVTDPVEALWLEACVWPDQADRFHRLVAAIELAREHPPELLAGDAVSSLRPAIERVGASAHPVVTNSWVLNYLTPAARIDYLAELDAIGAERDLSWVYAEAPALIPELPNEPDPIDPHRTVLSMARWRNGERAITHLATCHPHGYWIHWR